MKELISQISNSNIYKSIFVVIISFIFYSLFKKILVKNLNFKSKLNKSNPKRETSIKLVFNILKYLFWCISILLVLHINGINVSSLVAGVGILSAIIGLALQDALKDIIMGTNILVDSFFMVGDTIKYNNIEGKVISIGLKNTKIQDIYTKDIISIANRNINQVVTLSNIFFLNIPAPYEESIEKVEKTLESATNQIHSFEHVTDCKYVGLEDFADSSLIYKIQIDCKPEFKPSVRRNALRCIKKTFDKNNIEIPYQQIDMHSK